MEIRVAEIGELAAFEALRAEWDDLLGRAGHPELWLSHRWLSAWFRHFGAGRTLHVLIAREGERWIGALPLVRSAERWHGLAVRTLHFPINQESGNLRGGALLAERADAVAAAFVAHLVERADAWERLDLAGLPAASPSFAALDAALTGARLRAGTREVAQDLYYLPVSAGFDDWLATRGRKFRADLRQARNRMQRFGPVQLTLASEPGEIAAGLDAFLRLDALSAKSARPGVVHLAGAAGGFVREIAATFGATGDVRIALLADAETAHGSLFAVRHNGVLVLLHTAYSPAAVDVGAGRLVFCHVLETAFAEGIREIDFNGRTPFVRTFCDASRVMIAWRIWSPSRRARLAQRLDETIEPARRRAAAGGPLLHLTPSPHRKRSSAGPQTSEALRLATAASVALPAALRGSEVGCYVDGRTALAHALDALPLAAGDEILFPSYHCGSEYEVLVQRGYVLRFYPVPRTLEVDPADLERRIEKTTRAVYLIHYLGWPQDTRAIAAVCRRRGVLLLEDCAQAVYSGTDERPVGQLGDLAIFSLHKFLPVPDGGAAVVREKRPSRARPSGWREALDVRLHGATRAAADRPGWAGVASTIAARTATLVAHRLRLAPDAPREAIAKESLRCFETTDALALGDTRRRHYDALLAAFDGMRGAKPVFPAPGPGTVPLLFPVLVDNPAPLLAALRDAGVEAGIHWCAADPRVPLDDFPDAAFLKVRLVVLPLHQELGEAGIARIVATVAAVRAQAEQEGD